TRDLPVIFVTAVHDDRDFMARGYALGAIDYITKPFEPKFLVEKVRWFVSLWQRGEALARKDAELREHALQTARAEALREAAELANRAKDEFLAMVTHELLTPLTAMIGWTEMLKKGLVPPAEHAKVIDTIYDCGRAQQQLIEDLLDVSRIVAG